VDEMKTYRIIAKAENSNRIGKVKQNLKKIRGLIIPYTEGRLFVTILMITEKNLELVLADTKDRNVDVITVIATVLLMEISENLVDRRIKKLTPAGYINEMKRAFSIGFFDPETIKGLNKETADNFAEEEARIYLGSLSLKSVVPLFYHLLECVSHGNMLIPRESLDTEFNLSRFFTETNKDHNELADMICILNSNCRKTDTTLLTKNNNLEEKNKRAKEKTENHEQYLNSEPNQVNSAYDCFINMIGLEERILKMQDRKADLADRVIREGEEILTTISEEELLTLFEG